MDVSVNIYIWNPGTIAHQSVRSHRYQNAFLTLKKKSFNSKLSGNEVYFTNALLSLMKIMLCSKLHCHKVLN